MGFKEKSDEIIKKHNNNFMKFCIAIKIFFKTIGEYLMKLISGTSDPIIDYTKNPGNAKERLWYGFVGTIQDFFKEDESSLTPEEKIQKKRGEKSGTLPVPSLNFINYFIKNAGIIVSIGMLVGAIILNGRFRKQYIQQMRDNELNITGDIYQSDIYQGVEFGSIQPYFYNSSAQSNEYICLRDCYINCSYKSYLTGGFGSKPTTYAIPHIIKSGARALHFDVFEDLIGVKLDGAYIPHVRCPNNSIDDGISFDDMMKAVNNADPFSKMSNGNSHYPLILYLDFWYQEDKDIGTKNVNRGFRHYNSYESIYNILDYYFNDQLGITGSTAYGGGGNMTKGSDFGSIPYYLAQGRLLLISNVSPQTMDSTSGYDPVKDNIQSLSNKPDQSTKNIGNLASVLYGTINFKSASRSINIRNGSDSQHNPNMYGYIYTKEIANASGITGQQGGGIKDITTNARTGLYVVIPEDPLTINKYMWRKNITNPKFLDCFQHGMQMVFMCYQNGFDQVSNYIQFFNKSSFVIKRSELRNIINSPVKINQQAPQLSYTPISAAKVKDFVDYSL